MNMRVHKPREQELAVKIVESGGGDIVGAEDVIGFSDSGDFIGVDNDGSVFEYSELRIHGYDQCIVKDGNLRGGAAAGGSVRSHRC